MDVMFHAPYVLRPVLGLLGLALALAVTYALRHRGSERARAVPVVLLVLGLALIVGGGFELTALVPNARAADAALHTGISLAVAGAGAVLGAALARRGQSGLEKS